MPCLKTPLKKHKLGIDALWIAAGAFALIAFLLGIFGWPTSGRGLGIISTMLVMAFALAVQAIWLLVRARLDSSERASSRRDAPSSDRAVPVAGFGRRVKPASWETNDDSGKLVAASKRIPLAQIACAAPTRNGFIAVGDSHVFSPELGVLALLSGPDFNGGGNISVRVYAHPQWKGLRHRPSLSAPPFRDKQSGHLPGFVPVDGNPHTNQYRLGAFPQSLDAQDIVHGQIRLDGGIPLSKRALLIELIPLLASLKFWEQGSLDPVLFLPVELYSELLQIDGDTEHC